MISLWKRGGGEGERGERGEREREERGERGERGRERGVTARNTHDHVTTDNYIHGIPGNTITIFTFL